MKDTMFYFQVHQPRRIRPYRMSEIANNHDYFWDSRNREIMQRVASKCYIPATNTLIENGIRATFSISGIFLEQAIEYAPEIIEVFRDYFRSGLGELMAETYYHSLSSTWDENEFKDQVEEQLRTLSRIFGIRPKSFRNTELIFSDKISRAVKSMGFQTMITEGTDQIISDHSPNYLYSTVSGMNLLLRNYRLSDDVAFRFSSFGWNEYPLFADKYSRWISETPGEVANIFMDYETFGEHQWRETGIFGFLKALPRELEKRDIGMLTVGEAGSRMKSHGEISIPVEISWADNDRNLNAWLGNDMQREAMEKLKTFRGCENREIWRTLQTSDLIYYMSVRGFSDQEVHAYFNPYDSPYLAFIYYMAILEDFRRTNCR